MKRHFHVLAVGSLIFLVMFVRETSEAVVWSSNSGDAAAKNTVHLLAGLQQLGVYCVFAVLVVGHGILRRATISPVRENDLDESDRE